MKTTESRLCSTVATFMSILLAVVVLATGCTPKVTGTVDVPVGDDTATQIKEGTTISTALFAVLAAIWLIVLAAGRYQLRKVKERTVELVLSEIKVELKKNPSLTIEHFYELIYPKWCQMLKSTALFIPHKTELWPMPARPNYVKNRISFLPDVVGLFLANNKILLEGVEIEAENIEPNMGHAELRRPTLRLFEQICNLFRRGRSKS